MRCSLLNQQAFRLEKEFEVEHGFHRTPLVPGCLEALQYVSPGMARSAQCHLPNKPYSLCCAAQYYLAGARGYAAPDQLGSQAWPSNPRAAAQVPSALEFCSSPAEITPRRFRHQCDARDQFAAAPKIARFRATSKLTRRIRHGQRTQSPKEPMARNDRAEDCATGSARSD